MEEWFNSARAWVLGILRTSLLLHCGKGTLLNLHFFMGPKWCFSR